MNSSILFKESYQFSKEINKFIANEYAHANSFQIGAKKGEFKVDEI